MNKLPELPKISPWEFNVKPEKSGANGLGPNYHGVFISCAPWLKCKGKAARFSFYSPIVYFTPF